MPYYDFWRQDATAIRGAALLAKLREFVSKNRKAPEGVEALAPADSPDLKDAWHGDFQIAVSEKAVRLFSSGPDGQENTADDVEIGVVTLPPPAPVLPRSPRMNVMLERDTYMMGANTILTAGRVGSVSSGGCRVNNLTPDGLFSLLELREADVVIRSNAGTPKSVEACFKMFSSFSTKALRSMTVRSADNGLVKVVVSYR